MKIKWKKILQFKWFKRLYVLYIFGFVANFRPSLPFFYEFLIEERNATEVTEEIFPVLYYSTPVLLIPIFLLMEIFKYNPYIIISTLTGIVATCLYIWTSTLVELQVAQAFYGCMTAAELAYYVSVYSHGDIKTYQKLTSYVRAGPLAARFISSFLAQLFVSTTSLTYKDLHYFNLAAFVIATIITIFLPAIETNEKSFKLASIGSNLTTFTPNKYLVKWSVWSILTICGYNQFSFYVQPLWKHIQITNDDFVYNGVLEGLYAVFGLIGTILGGYATFDWKYKGDLLLSMTSLVEGFLLLLMSQITNVALNSFFYISLGFMYHFMMTVLCGEIAKLLEKGTFGLLFGGIALFAWALSAGMVCLLNDGIGMQIENYTNLFMIYGFYHVCLSVSFIVIGLSYWFAKHTYQ